MEHKVFRMAPWVLGAASVAALFFLGVAANFYFYGDSYLLRIAGAAVAAVALGATLEALASKIVIEPETLLVISLFRRRSFPRSDFESARLDGGAVVLKRRDGGWLILPGTGRDALAIRNAIHAWIQRGLP